MCKQSQIHQTRNTNSNIHHSEIQMPSQRKHQTNDAHKHHSCSVAAPDPSEEHNYRGPWVKAGRAFTVEATAQILTPVENTTRGWTPRSKIYDLNCFDCAQKGTSPHQYRVFTSALLSWQIQRNVKRLHALVHAQTEVCLAATALLRCAS